MLRRCAIGQGGGGGGGGGLRSSGVRDRSCRVRRTQAMGGGGGGGGGDAAQRPVVVIGAGAAGLAALKEIKAEGLEVVAYESRQQLGGVWLYEDATIQSKDEGRESLGENGIFSSIYDNLRTNLPRDLMAYQEFPFEEKFGDERLFCKHSAVLEYLRSYATHHQLEDSIRLGHRVLEAFPVDEDGERIWLRAPKPGQLSEFVEQCGASRISHWRVRVATPKSGETVQDCRAVIVANGHYSLPHLPQGIAGIDTFPNLVIHSHSYRNSKAFENCRRILVVGAGASGEDIAKELAMSKCAKGDREVYIVTRKQPKRRISNLENIYEIVGVPKVLHTDGSAELDNGLVLEDVDAVAFCTGYLYDYPFLQWPAPSEDGSQYGCITTLNEGRAVFPVFDQVFVPGLGPSLSFLGLPWKVVPFPQFELQSRWVASAIAKSCANEGGLSVEGALPAVDHMVDVIEREIREHEENDSLRYYHRLEGELQWQYNDRLAKRTLSTPLPGWRKTTFDIVGHHKKKNPDTYRDSSDSDVRMALPHVTISDVSA